MPKSRTLFCAHFWSNCGQTLFGWCKMTQILYQIYFFVKQSNTWCIFFICLWKIVKGWSEKLEIWHTENLDPVLKKARKQQFSPGSPSLWILHLKSENICQYFSLHELLRWDFRKWLFYDNSTRPQELGNIQGSED